MIRVRIMSDGREVAAVLRDLAVTCEDRGRLLRIAGERMVQTEIPRVFRTGGPGWPPLRPPPMGRVGRPLLDTGRLRDSIVYRVFDGTLELGTNAPGAELHQYGGTVVPRVKRWLAIPLSPPLSVSERRAASPRSFPNAVCWIRGDRNHGYTGPGIYRKTSRMAYSLVTRRPHPIFEKIFALVKSVRIQKREFLRFDAPMLDRIVADWVQDMRERANG